ncbi:MAG: bifunctional (p)ppGpp synthetase/guanosine-3',5'-bis(diphosphate) 3'-pyrophosphohydrolase [Clostridiales bacterium]|nr:bifunctional (p)ppGpp synthetase/guanosine-3',5'-bis(diphosphate) 3'-pyrophosphohydrolase [Clostridiales bacterium]
MDYSLQSLEDKIRLYHPAKDLSKVELAYHLAEKAHDGQLRQSGEPYVIHPIRVAQYLADLELDLESIIAGLLHDVIEDTYLTTEDIESMFGEDVAALVNGVTKLKQLKYETTDKEEIQAENYRKLFLAMAKDIRVILIKLADRLHNMQTLEYKSRAKQIDIARETLDIYAPIAHRLGISKIQVELEDLALKYLEPDIYYDLVQKINKKRSERESFMSHIVEQIHKALEEVDIPSQVYGRPKHFFSIYRKMVKKSYSLDQIYDLFAVRIIVDSVKDCYGALGIIHDMYTPMPGRFKDYIAMPKANMYQSLHTTLISHDGQPFEVQIRTVEMHRTAEYGIAAHWKYKEQNGSVAVSEEEKMNWLQKVLEWQQDLSDNKDFLNALRVDFDAFQEQVYAFSPKGDVIELAAGSTPIDFAYQIHSAVGNKMVGARVNGRIVTLNYEIKNGDRVEIITSQNSKGPSRDWLNIVATSQARNKINQWFKKESKQDNIARGHEAIERYAKSKGLVLADLLRPEWMEIVQHKYGFQDWDAIQAAVGHGGLKEGQVVNRLYQEYMKEKNDLMEEDDIIASLTDRIQRHQENENEYQRHHKINNPITVHGINDIAVHFSKCCNPVPGDEIIGYVTRGRGVSIHRTDCQNIIQLSEEERRRLLDAEWEVGSENTKGMKFITSVQVVAEDRKGILMDITSVISNADIMLTQMNARRKKDSNEAIFNMSFEITSKEQLHLVATKIQQVPGVYEVIRSTN